MTCPHHPSSYYSSRYPELHPDLFHHVIHPPFIRPFYSCCFSDSLVLANHILSHNAPPDVAFTFTTCHIYYRPDLPGNVSAPHTVLINYYPDLHNPKSMSYATHINTPLHAVHVTARCTCHCTLYMSLHPVHVTARCTCHCTLYMSNDLNQI